MLVLVVSAPELSHEMPANGLGDGKHGWGDGLSGYHEFQAHVLLGRSGRRGMQRVADYSETAPARILHPVQTRYKNIRDRNRLVDWQVFVGQTTAHFHLPRAFVRQRNLVGKNNHAAQRSLAQGQTHNSVYGCSLTNTDCHIDVNGGAA